MSRHRPDRLQRAQPRAGPRRERVGDRLRLARSRSSSPAPRAWPTPFDIPGGRTPGTSSTGPRRKPLVHRAGGEQLEDRPDHPAGEFGTAVRRDGRRRSARHHRRPRRRALVRPGGRERHRPDDPGRASSHELKAGITAGGAAGVHRAGARQHALVHREGRQPDRAHHRHRRSHKAGRRHRLTRRRRTSPASGSPGRCSGSVVSAP